MATLPTSLFDEQWYLARNPDVAEAIAQGLLSSALEHFELFGKHEGRPASPLFNPEDYLQANPDVAEAVNAGLITAYDHFLQFGASEGRAPLSLFDPDFYLAQNPDVAAAVEAGLITATEHFLLYGQTEPRYVAPFINLGAYLNANSDVAQATQNGAVSPLVHLLTHGVEEGRNLGNGVDLSIFKNDPKFEEALASGNVQGALERVGEVAPFLPTFEPPANWEPAPDTPIPVDFVPPEGVKLVVPPTVDVPADVELPEDVFEPVTPQPQPTPEPTPTKTFTVTESKDGVVSFSGSATGDITVIVNEGNVATFTRGAVTATKTVTDLANKTINLSATQNLLLTPEQISQLPIKTTGEGNVKVGFSNTDNDNLIGAKGSNVKNLSLSLDNATVTLPADKDKNLLVDAAYEPGGKDLKTLNVNASGKSSLDLGNHVLGDDGVGYFLSAVNITGGTSGDSLALKKLYFGSENTKFNSTGYSGDVNLDAYVYNGTSEKYAWEIKFGGGNDTLVLGADGSGNYPGKYGSVIDGGEGTNTLVLHANVYQQWANPDTNETGENTVTNFQVLSTAAANNRVYEATLLGNTFDSLVLAKADSGVKITVNGYKSIDASALKGSESVINVGTLAKGGTTIKVAALKDGDSGNKTDLGNGAPEGTTFKGSSNQDVTGTGRKSDVTVKLPALNEISGNIAIENLTIASTNGYQHDPVVNDVVDLTSWGLESANDLAGLVKSITISQGADLSSTLPYVNFVLEIQNGDSTFDLALNNLVSKNVYNTMLKALATVDVEANHLASTLNLVGWKPNEGQGWVTSLEGTSYANKVFTSDNVVFTQQEDAQSIIKLVGLMVNEGTFAGVPTPSEV